ncbi:hypothetical protein HMPREF9530_03297 [Escherichia coli MS 21-1]|nr:hypothetical protein HMPREF9530_03297 [Escherichia coli MS 21-1]
MLCLQLFNLALCFCCRISAASRRSSSNAMRCSSVKCCVFAIPVLHANNKPMAKDNVDFFIIYVP